VISRKKPEFRLTDQFRRSIQPPHTHTRLDKLAAVSNNVTHTSHFNILANTKSLTPDVQMGDPLNLLKNAKMRILRVRSTYFGLLVATVLLVSPLAHKNTTGQDVGRPTQVVASVYTPVEAELLAEYNRDGSNKKVQTWRQYWDWVQTFYRGNILSEGWIKFSQVTLDVVKAEAERGRVLEHLNELGKLISREWAKDASVRKISTADLRRWYNAISAARGADDGTGQHILKILKVIQKKAESLKGL
jgi:hypothetical protein